MKIFVRGHYLFQVVNCELLRTNNVQGKYLSIFSPQMEAIVFIILQIFFGTCAVMKIGEYSLIFPSFSWGIFAHVTCLLKSHVSKHIWRIIKQDLSVDFYEFFLTRFLFKFSFNWEDMSTQKTSLTNTLSSKILCYCINHGVWKCGQTWSFMFDILLKRPWRNFVIFKYFISNLTFLQHEILKLQHDLEEAEKVCDVNRYPNNNLVTCMFL